MTPRPRAGRDQPALTQDVLVQAALTVLERDGLDALSMRRVASELGLQAASLYWHVRNKEELLDLVADAALAGLDLSVVEGDWRAQVRVLAHRYRALLKSRRDVPRLIAGRFVVGRHSSVMMEHVLGIFRSADFSPGGAAAAMYLTSVTYVQGFVLQEMNPMRAVEAMGGTPVEAMADVSAELADLPPEAFPHLAEASHYLTTMDLDERFDWGLECILDGLALRVTGSQRSP
ncbi:TetR/AcrR family transcriptional regulator [Cellulomonas sp. P22]|uniref:TetR/AcrR family transcriptional regulator n=1 Tax=Cellulomonas sp. P22 TaxID=3373189 RepID=UPI0037AF32DC